MITKMTRLLNIDPTAQIVKVAIIFSRFVECSGSGLIDMVPLSSYNEMLSNTRCFPVESIMWENQTILQMKAIFHEI